MGCVKDRYRGTPKYYVVHRELMTAAEYRGTVTYQEIAWLMGLPLAGGHMAGEVGHILGEISEDEHKDGRPMLSAVATKATGKQGSGFFDLARRLGKLRGRSREDEEQLWDEERSRVYETWKKCLKNK